MFVGQVPMLLAFAVNFSPGQSIPPFVAEANVSQKLFKSKEAAPYSTSDAIVVFQYSNGWWRVQEHVEAGPGKGRETDCMRIPDGIRVYHLFDEQTNGGSFIATASPIVFPPPGLANIFSTWLALCPDPTLPLIDAKRIRRFLTVGGDGQAGVLNDRRNVGAYGLSYVEPENAFIRTLAITNNGFVLADRGYVGPHAPPFEHGFIELHYELLETTNVNGHVFPLRAVFRRFVPNYPGKNRDDLSPTVITELTVRRLSIPQNGQFSIPATGPVIYAIDSRPAGLPTNGVVGYFVTNDHWKPSSDPEIVRRVRAVPGAVSTPHSAISSSRIVARIVIGAAIVVTLITVIWRSFKLDRQTWS